MLMALRADRPDLPADCYKGFRVSTVNARYGAVDDSQRLPVCGGVGTYCLCEGNRTGLPRRSGPADIAARRDTARDRRQPALDAAGENRPK
jgi:hypothetical protein